MAHQVLSVDIDRDGCIGCGLCASICPDVFRMADDGKAEVFVPEVPQGSEGGCVQAQESCPVSVITCD